MSDRKIIRLEVSKDFQIPFNPESLTPVHIEFIIKTGFDALETVKCELDMLKDDLEHMAELKRQNAVMALQNTLLEAENNNFKTAIHNIDKVINSKPVIEIMNDDKWIRNFLKKHSIPTLRKREDNLAAIQSWANTNGLTMTLISPL